MRHRIMNLVIVTHRETNNLDERDVVMNPMNHPCPRLPLLRHTTVKMTEDVVVVQENVGVVTTTRKIVLGDMNETTETMMNTLAAGETRTVDTEMKGTVTVVTAVVTITTGIEAAIAAVETVVEVVVAVTIETTVDGRGIKGDVRVRTVTVARLMIVTGVHLTTI